MRDIDAIRGVFVASLLALMAGSAWSIAAEPEKAGVTPASAAPKEPKVDLRSKPTLYVVGYAHLDTEWRWAYPQTIREFIADTLHKNFDLFEKYPGYVFNFSGSRRYQMMKEYYPAEYERLKGYIAAGKWFPCGSSVDENDANVPSAESFVRHMLYGNRFFRREFGIASDEFMLPDCFGFPAALPTLLNHCGIQGFSTQKLTWGSPVGIPFKVGRWIGPDGSEVLAALDPGAYVGQVKENLANSESWKTRIQNNGAKSGVFVDYHYYGTGDQGGAPTPESVAMVEESVKTNGAIKVISGPADWMFHAIKPDMQSGLPAYKGELLLTEHSAGSITSQAYMKRWNRKNEQLADAAERAAVAAWWLTGEAYPAQRLEDGWSLVLGSQMHDILPGTSLPKAYEYAWNDEIIAGNVFSQVLTHAVDAISSRMDTHTQGTSVLVYNPLAVDRRDCVDAEIPWSSEWRSVRVIGPDGKDVPAQVDSVKDAKAHVVFAATAPSMSFSVFDVRPVQAGPGGPTELKASGRTIENANLSVTVDENGDIASVFDKVQNKEMLAEPARLALLYEKPRDWPAWNMDWADRQKPARSFVGGPAKVAVTETGPARATLTVEREHEGSKFLQHIRLAAESRRVDIETHLDWKTKERSLKQAFVLAASNPIATYDIQAGAIQRDNNSAKRYENPSHQWFDLTDTSGAFGVSVLSDSKYGSDKPDDRTLRLTLVYTPGVRGGYQDQGTQDIGKHEMVYSLYPHAGGWENAGTAQEAARVNQPLRAFVVPKHAGTIGKQLSLGAVEDGAVVMTAAKKAEDSDEVIVRLRETTGRDAKGVRVRFGSAVVAARELDGQERNIGPAQVADGDLVAEIRGFGLRAYALKLAPTQSNAESPAQRVVELPFDTVIATSRADVNAARLDADGRSFPAEQLPREIAANGVRFKVGNEKAQAVACEGQSIVLPSRGGGTVHVLAVSKAGDRDAEFAIAGKAERVRIQSWRGFIGRWDNRLWGGEVPEMAFQWKNPWEGLVPGYIKPASVAWWCSHHHTAQGDAHYQYCYIFEHEFAVPPGAATLELPNDPNVLVLGATMVEGRSAGASAAWPLFDTLADHTQDTSRIVVTGEPQDCAMVRIDPGLYWRAGAFRYTLDGTEPTIDSPAYLRPFAVGGPTIVKAAMFDEHGKLGPIVEKRVVVQDRMPPKLVRAEGGPGGRGVRLYFSEPLDEKTATQTSKYTILPNGVFRSAGLSPDGTCISLLLVEPLVAGTKYTVFAKGMADRSPAHNAQDVAADLMVKGPVYSLETFSPGSETLEVRNVAGLPVGGSKPWTINGFIRVEKQPENRTLIAGFGRTSGATGGDGRYLAKFSGGVHFWSHHGDLSSKSALDVGSWQMLTATFDGRTVRLYKDGVLLGENEGELADDENVVRIAPIDPWDKERRFEGEIRHFTIWDAALAEDAIRAMRAEAKLP